ncbi:DUF4236 domain-containing protein [Cellulomonas algicola]|uniref:DUF4236 domain-containing protein n=1 Tax=Cellulomonas algicola TaxID=2071633 RepID=UPI001C3F7678|nr:DUF4236 domain-containing protein [Cellulomonas algicola]
MGFRVRKSFKVMPGVRMTVTPRGVSTSVGVNGARVRAHSSGRVTGTVGIPGSGVSYTTSAGGASRARTGAPPRAVAPVSAPKPGMLAPRWEKALHAAAVLQRDPGAVQRVAAGHSEAQRTAALLEALLGALPSNDVARVQELLGWLWREGYEPATDPFLSRYLPQAALALEITPEISVELPLTRDTIGLTLAEALQSAGDVRGASDIVEEVTPSTVAAVSLAELYAEQARWADVIALTDGVANEDEASMYLLVQRAVALRSTGNPGAAREALKEALRLRSRPAQLRHRALVERAYTYLAENKRAMARKDLEKVLAEDSSYPGLAEAMAELPRE